MDALHFHIFQLPFFVVCLNWVPSCYLFVFHTPSVSDPLCVPAGFFAIVVSCVAVAAAVYQDVDLTYIHSHFLQLTTASFLLSVLLSVYLYVRSHYAAPEQLALGGSSGETSSYLLTDHILCVGSVLLIYSLISLLFTRQRGLWLFQRTWAQSPHQRLWSEILLRDAPWSDWMGKLSWDTNINIYLVITQSKKMFIVVIISKTGLFAFSQTHDCQWNWPAVSGCLCTTANQCQCHFLCTLHSLVAICGIYFYPQAWHILEEVNADLQLRFPALRSTACEHGPCQWGLHTVVM